MRIGIIGGGQLARMLALAGHPLGIRFTFLDPAPDACAAPLGNHVQGAYDDPDLLRELGANCDVITYEFESVPEKAVALLSQLTTVHPSANALSVSRDRLREKRFFQELGLPTPAFHPVKTLTDLEQAVAKTGLPAVLKTRTLGYDGKGQALLRVPADLSVAMERLGAVPLILESFIPFDREISIIAARNRSGSCAFYPISENTHRDGILHMSRSRIHDEMQGQAEKYARTLLEALGYVGVLALELFQTGDSLVVNEMAPRVHNSGHWTIEGASVSQFENHLRAILDLPLGDTAARGHSAMINFIGELPDAGKLLALPGVHLHRYGKPPRPGRKLGHTTIRADTETILDETLKRLLSLEQHTLPSACLYPVLHHEPCLDGLVSGHTSPPP